MEANSRCRSVLQGLFIVMLTVALGAGPALAQAPAAQQKPADVKSVAATAKTQAVAKRSAGPQEGIKVHGHWVIEVRNPDGSLASRSEFENALQPGGNVALARLLAPAQAGGIIVRNWMLLIGSTAASLCPSQNTLLPVGLCVIVPASFPDSPPGVFKNLTATLPGSGANVLQLNGNFTAEAAATIDVVHSLVQIVSVSDSNSVDSRIFSSKTLATADQKQVVAGQIVQVTLTISFS